jgi:hypothetical protein
MHGSTGGGWKRTVGHGTREMSAGRETAGKAPGPTAFKRHRASPRPYTSRVILDWDCHFGLWQGLAECGRGGSADVVVGVSGVLVVGGRGRPWPQVAGRGRAWRRANAAARACRQGQPASIRRNDRRCPRVSRAATWRSL